MFATELSTSFAQDVLDAIYTYAPFIQFTIDEPLRRVGGVLLQEDSCEISLIPVNYTDTMSVFPTIMPSSPAVQPTLGMCYIILYEPCRKKKLMYGVSDKVMLNLVCLATVSCKNIIILHKAR